MLVQKNKKLPFIPPITMDIDDVSDLPYKVSDPLPKKSFGMLIVGQPGSGKSTLLCSMLLSKPTKKKKNIPLFYNSYFDHIYLISPSKHTLPLDKLNFNEDRIYDSYSDQHLADIISKEKEDDNLNNLIVLDDCVRDLKNTTDLCRCVLNRRHITQNNENKEKQDYL
jgi:GTPase SAR1 family protein